MTTRICGRMTPLGFYVEDKVSSPLWDRQRGWDLFRIAHRLHNRLLQCLYPLRLLGWKP